MEFGNEMQTGVVVRRKFEIRISKYETNSKEWKAGKGRGRPRWKSTSKPLQSSRGLLPLFRISIFGFRISPVRGSGRERPEPRRVYWGLLAVDGFAVFHRAATLALAGVLAGAAVVAGLAATLALAGVLALAV